MKLIQLVLPTALPYLVNEVFTIREGRVDDEFNSANFPFMDLKDVITKMKTLPEMSNLFNGEGATLVNVGASNKNVDPLYSLPLNTLFPSGFKLIGYECDAERAKYLAETLSYVTVRQLCLSQENVTPDMREAEVPRNFAVLKTDIDSIDAPVLDAILSEYKPAIIASEFIWDWPPPIDFTLVRQEEGRVKIRDTNGCFGMSLNLAHRVLQSHGYSIICASFINLIAIPTSLVTPNKGIVSASSGSELGAISTSASFVDLPNDPYFWYQLIKSPHMHTHWVKEFGGSPFMQLEHGIFSETSSIMGQGADGFQKPPIQHRTVDKTMTRVAQVVASACGGSVYMLALGDRCCAPQWFHDRKKPDNCVCSLQAH